MKNTSKLIVHLLASSILIGCSTNKSAISQSQKIDIQASTKQQLVSANTANEYLQLAKMYADKKNHEMAIVAYQKALLIEPNNTKGLTGLATAYAAQNLFSVAIPLFEKVVALEATAKHYSNLGYAYYLNQQYDEAKRVLNQAVVMDPEYIQAKHNLALVDANYVADKEVKTLAEKDGNVDYIVVNKAETNAIGDLVVADTASNALQESSAGIYEINFPTKQNEPVAQTTASTAPQSVPAKQTEVPASQQMVATISGGITFKHMPVISKLFDLATNGVISMQLASNNHYMEIVNGNGLKGVAKSVANQLNERGIQNIRVADAKRFNQSRTHIQYRTGYRDDAVNLNHNLLNRPFLLRNDNLPADVKIRLVLGKDLMANMKHAELNMLRDMETNS